MGFSLRRVRPIHLAFGTLAYWAGLALVKLTHPLLLAWRLTHLPAGQSSIEAGYSGSAIHVTMKQLETVVWSGSISAGALILWLFGPPAVMIGAWWLSSQGGDDLASDDPNALSSAPGNRALPASGLPSSNVTRQISQELDRKPPQG